MIVILILLGMVALGWLWLLERRAAQASAGLQAELHRADQLLTRESTDARRAMNDAAGQSWRNLAG